MFISYEQLGSFTFNISCKCLANFTTGDPFIWFYDRNSLKIKERNFGFSYSSHHKNNFDFYGLPYFCLLNDCANVFKILKWTIENHLHKLSADLVKCKTSGLKKGVK